MREIRPVELKKTPPDEYSRRLTVAVILLVVCLLVAVSALVVSVVMCTRLLNSRKIRDNHIEEVISRLSVYRDDAKAFNQRLDRLTSELLERQQKIESRLDDLEFLQFNSTSELQQVQQHQQQNRFAVNGLRLKFTSQRNLTQQMEIDFRTQLNHARSVLSQVQLTALIPAAYVRIPSSGTFMGLGLGTKYLTWEGAKAECESRGQRLLILDTADKAAWMQDRLDEIKRNSSSPLGRAWSGGIWIGGKYISGGWKWYNGTHWYPAAAGVGCKGRSENNPCMNYWYTAWDSCTDCTGRYKYICETY